MAYRFAVSFNFAIVVQIDCIEDSNCSSTAHPPVVIQTTIENRCYPTYLMRLQREPGVGLRYPRTLAYWAMSKDGRLRVNRVRLTFEFLGFSDSF